MKKREIYAGILWGTAVGDSLGLPAEGISRDGIEKRGWKDNWKQRLLFGHGMLSDDTEHTLIVAESLATHPNDVVAFQKILAKKLRWWLLALPAGVGMATARALVKLWLGFPSTKSGVFSAGNGPAMRSAIIGAYFAESPDQIDAYVRASTKITHTDPKALVGALAIAYCAATPDDLPRCMRQLKSLAEIEPSEWPTILNIIKQALDEDWTTTDLLNQLGSKNGISGYIYHTVPAALFVWFKWYDHDDMFKGSMNEILNCGGDTDTAGAILGALSGAKVGCSEIPKHWISKIKDWPRGRIMIERNASILIEHSTVHSPIWIFCLLRNFAFLLIVLSHGLLRLIPSSLRLVR